MKNLLRKITLLAVAGAMTLSVNAQEEKGIQFNVSGDFVSSYVWRGMYQSNAAVQPTLGLSIKGFSLTAWGSTDFTGIAKEVDLTAAYSLNGFTVSVADMWWGGQGALKYFKYKNKETAHHFEAGLAYALPCEKFPLSIAWYTMFAGDDQKIDSEDQNYSSYVELNYPFSVKGIGLNATLGLTPYAAEYQYRTTGFAVTNIALKATKEIQITKSFSLPLFTQLIFNPAQEDVHLVLGFTLR